MLTNITEIRALNENHVYKDLNTIDQVKKFMALHVFAVWDFMSLLKALQRKLTTVELPWQPSTMASGNIVRFINEIVLCEESDKVSDGSYLSHFEIYIKAMKEVGANPTDILEFINSKFDLNIIPVVIRQFVKRNLDIAQSEDIIQIAATFLYGREKIIPEMFNSFLSTLSEHKVHAPLLKYYLQRHVEVDADEHGPLAEKCLVYLCQGDPKKEARAVQYAKEAVNARIEFWDAIHSVLKQEDLVIS